MNICNNVDTRTIDDIHTLVALSYNGGHIVWALAADVQDMAILLTLKNLLYLFVEHPSVSGPNDRLDSLSDYGPIGHESGKNSKRCRGH